ncbi:MAG: exo-beta-N-acetylmuramidase NamZ family protein [Gemmatimonadales bacterium]
MGLWGCIGCAAGPGSAAAPARVRPGIDGLLADSIHLVRNRRIGLVTNQAGVDAEGVRDLDRLIGEGLRVTAVFAPEHGLRGSIDVDRAPESRQEVDSATGTPVYLLHDGVRLHAPSATMLADVDVLVIDLQDAGARYYSYPAAVATVMSAGKGGRIPVVVLDRPNPIGGAVQGDVQDSTSASAVARFPIAMRHGMTIGELARLANSVLRLGADLHVIPMDGWRRYMHFDATGLPFMPPSLNLPTLESLFHYPGLCLLEGTNLSVGRGTDAPFEQVGAPWLDTTAVLEVLRRAAPAGVRFAGVRFKPDNPGDGKYPDTIVAGIRLITTDRASYDPTVTAVHLLAALRTAHPDDFTFRPAQFDRLAGGAELRTAIQRGDPVPAAVADWGDKLTRFKERRRPFLLYPE